MITKHIFKCKDFEENKWAQSSSLQYLHYILYLCHHYLYYFSSYINHFYITVLL